MESIKSHELFKKTGLLFWVMSVHHTQSCTSDELEPLKSLLKWLRLEKKKEGLSYKALNFCQQAD